MIKDLNMNEALMLNSIKAYDEGGVLVNGMHELAIDLIVPNPDQPRKKFEPEELQELATSLKNYGLIQPIIVSPLGEKYMIVAGERRFRASKIAGFTKIPVIIRNFNDQQVDEISLIENLQRKDLNPIEEARAYKALIEKYGFTQEELAEKLGKSRPVITNALRMLNLNPVVVEMLIAGKLSAGHARCLASIKDYTVQLSYALAACDKAMSVRQLENMVYNYLNTNKTPRPVKPAITPELKELVNNMQKVFGTKIKAVGNNNKGRIYIDYFTKDDLSRIYDLINKEVRYR